MQLGQEKLGVPKQNSVYFMKSAYQDLQKRMDPVETESHVTAQCGDEVGLESVICPYADSIDGEQGLAPSSQETYDTCCQTCYTDTNADELQHFFAGTRESRCFSTRPVFN